jgi:putative PIN family toxin of toxin-antitoxin system
VRAIVDSNIFVSYLLNKDSTGTISEVLRVAAQGRIRLALPPEQLVELRRVVTTKPYLRERISLRELERFILLLETLGDILPPIQGDPPRVLRDRADDFLVETAKQNKVGIIVSGDLDLLEWQGARPQLAVIAPAHLEHYLNSREANQS